VVSKDLGAGAPARFEGKAINLGFGRGMELRGEECRGSILRTTLIK